MERELMDLVTHPEPELVFAVVGPLGSDIDDVQRNCKDIVQQSGYHLSPIKLSDIARELNAKHFGLTVHESPDDLRIDSLMTLGNAIRQRCARGDALALHAVAKIALSRDQELATPRPVSQPHPRRIHFLNSLKHHSEVEALRRVYGPGFFLIGVNAPREDRLSFLRERRGISTPRAEELLKRDEGEDDGFGQKTRDTFALADVFVSSPSLPDLGRFIDMVFGSPFNTPTADEHAMFLAYAASMRSGQLGRQVGAVITNASGEIIATGANDVPQFKGGLQWPGPDDHRDHTVGVDSNDVAIQDIVDEILDLVGTAATVNRDDLSQRLRRRSQLGDLTEFGRVVHAEMEALLSCARAGVSPRHGTLYTTTFPCHNCAKHIVDAGITKVVYVEPYPKSRALKLHHDTVTLDARDTSKVRFVPFVGVASRRYLDLFSMTLGGGMPMVRKKDGRAVEWTRSGAKPRLRMSPFSYMAREQLVVDLLESEVGTRLNAAQGSPVTTQER